MVRLTVTRQYDSRRDAITPENIIQSEAGRNPHVEMLCRDGGTDAIRNFDPAEDKPRFDDPPGDDEDALYALLGGGRPDSATGTFTAENGGESVAMQKLKSLP